LFCRQHAKGQFYNPALFAYHGLAMVRREPIASREYAFTAVFEPAEEGGYVVTFPAIPELATQGESLDEARAMAADCLRCYLEARSKDGLPLPQSEQDHTGAILSQVKVSLQMA
jgi:predicted RNase H-like HicB family nuclease